MRLFVLVLALAAGCGDTTASTQAQAIGTACTASTQCGTNKFFCDTDHPNGYCKRDCKVDGDCPAGSVCAGALPNAPGACHKTCATATASTDCRLTEGYVCKDMPDDASGPYCDVPEAG
jgi:hypothetical protein